MRHFSQHTVDILEPHYKDLWARAYWIESQNKHDHIKLTWYYLVVVTFLLLITTWNYDNNFLTQKHTSTAQNTNKTYQYGIDWHASFRPTSGGNKSYAWEYHDQSNQSYK